MFGMTCSHSFGITVRVSLEFPLISNISERIYGINQSGEAFLNVKIDLTKDELKQLLHEIDEIIKQTLKFENF